MVMSDSHPSDSSALMFVAAGALGDRWELTPRLHLGKALVAPARYTSTMTEIVRLARQLTRPYLFKTPGNDIAVVSVVALTDRRR